ncbi:MAG: hypothetical protein KZQ99_21640 [Candidatus Thiodiazotropha sp. (ex Dulcina madagascariensis)]|nr:hypothetical protein [Candidatus Thiodiazotropha sp. (ex Dulcina madagascariensis)]
MTSYPERRKLVDWINEAVVAGARKQAACEAVGISLRTLRRWTLAGKVDEDRRPLAQRPGPANKLTEQERLQILETCNQGEYVSLLPSQIVPRLVDKGIYLASESSF